MEKISYQFGTAETHYYLDEQINNLNKYVDAGSAIIITDENVQQLHGDKWKSWPVIVIPAGEDNKSLSTFQYICDQLIEKEADRKTHLIGIGGGMVTDLTGYVAAAYMRGVQVGFVPTTLLAQVDAAVGGKNGINYGKYKNILGTIRQPDFLIFDFDLLESLPQAEWSNGYAEIIKYACIQDAEMFDFLEQHVERALKGDREVVTKLVKQAVKIKSDIVVNDERESGMRRWLNFGHTIGHPVEKLEKIPHGQAVAKGMVIAAKFSQELSGLKQEEVGRIINLIKAYQLPIDIRADHQKICELFRLDKKREKDFIHFILLNKIGEAITQPISFREIAELLDNRR